MAEEEINHSEVTSETERASFFENCFKLHDRLTWDNWLLVVAFSFFYFILLFFAFTGAGIAFWIVFGLFIIIPVARWFTEDWLESKAIFLSKLLHGLMYVAVIFTMIFLFAHQYLEHNLKVAVWQWVMFGISMLSMIIAMLWFWWKEILPH